MVANQEPNNSFLIFNSLFDFILDVFKLIGNTLSILISTSIFQNYAARLIFYSLKLFFYSELMISINSNTNFLIDSFFVDQNYDQNDSID